jgi:hypothetical protein
MRIEDQKVANQGQTTILETKSIGLNPPKKKGKKKRRAHDLKNQDAS